MRELNRYGTSFTCIAGGLSQSFADVLLTRAIGDLISDVESETVFHTILA